MLYMILERFHGGDPVPVYRRLHDRGRLMPEGLRYVTSWVSADLGRCFQVVECDDAEPLERWLAAWNDLVAFEVVPVVTSAEAQAAVSARLA